MRHLAPQAQADLDDAVSWLLDSGFAPAKAEGLLTAVMQAASRLIKHPFLGHHRPDLLPEPFRFCSIPRHNLILVYEIRNEKPIILRILSTHRDIDLLLDDLRESQ